MVVPITSHASQPTGALLDLKQVLQTRQAGGFTGGFTNLQSMLALLFPPYATSLMQVHVADIPKMQDCGTCCCLLLLQML